MSGMSSNMTSHMLSMAGNSSSANNPNTGSATQPVSADILADILFSPIIQSQLFAVHGTQASLPTTMLLTSPVMSSNPHPPKLTLNHSLSLNNIGHGIPNPKANNHSNEPGYIFAPSLPNYTNAKLAGGASPALGNSSIVAGDVPLSDADLAVLDTIPMSSSLVQMDHTVPDSHMWNSGSDMTHPQDQHHFGQQQYVQQNYATHNHNNGRNQNVQLSFAGIGSPSTASSDSPSVFNSSTYIAGMAPQELKNATIDSRVIPSLPSQSYSLTASQIDSIINSIDNSSGATDNSIPDASRGYLNASFAPWLSSNQSTNSSANIYDFEATNYVAPSDGGISMTADQRQILASRPEGVPSNNQASPQFSPAPVSQRQSSISSLPIDQLNLLSIQTSKSPSPNDYVFGSIQGPQIPNSNGNNSSNSIVDSRSIHTNTNTTASSNTNTTTNTNTNTSANTTPNPNTYTDNTINPKKLFRSNRLISTSLSSPSLTTLFKDSIYSIHTNYPPGKRYSQTSNQGSNNIPNAMHNQNQPISFPAISNLPLVTTALPHGVNGSSRSSSTSASSSTTVGTTDTALTEIVPPASLNMNDECFNAISYWLNNSDNEENNMIHNPTGIIMNRNLTLNNGMGLNYIGTNNSSNTKQRRNSIQSSNPSNYINCNSYILKRKCRKSSTNGNGLEMRQQVKDLFLSQQNSLHGHVHNNENDESALFIQNGNMIAENNGNFSIPLGQHQRSRSLNNPNLHPYLIEEQDGEALTMTIDSPQPNMSHENALDDNHGNIPTSMHSNMAPPRAPLSATTPSSLHPSSKGAARVAKSEPKESHKPISGGLLEKQAIQLDITNSATNTTTTVTVVPHGSGDNIIFGCPLCDKQFKRSEHLKRHHRSVHSNIRPFHCTFCEKKFSRLDNLAQHLKTHYKMGANSGAGGRRRKESI